MRTLARMIVGLLTVIGALAVVVLVVGLVALKSAPASLGGTPASPSTSSAPAGKPNDLIANNLSADVVVPFARLEQQAGNGVRLGDAGGGKIRVNAPFSAFGRDLRVETDGNMTVQGNDVVVQPTTLRIEGLSALDGVLSVVARQAAGVKVPITDLPKGVTVKTVTSTKDGLKAHVEGNGVPLPAS